MTIRICLAAITVIFTTTGTHAVADDACADVVTDLTVQRADRYADLIASTFSEDLEPSERLLPSDVEISAVLENGDWSAVNAAIPTADIAMLFFEKVDGEKQFKDAWGGMAEPSERPELIEWAEALGAPENLATCFADQMVSDADEVSPFGFTVDLSFSTDALDRLTKLGEEVIVSASYYGEPSAKGEEFADDTGRFVLGTEDVQAPAAPAIVQITGDQVGENDLEWIDGAPNVNVNVFTARLSGDLNLISCDFIDGPLEDVIQSMPVALQCALIEEEIETELKP